MESPESFADRQREQGLVKFLSSDPGTLYFDPLDFGPGRSLVRYLPVELGAGFAAAYAAIVAAVRDWVCARPAVDELVEVLPIEMVGPDYVVRAHRIYVVSTESYAHPEDGVSPPAELERMHRVVEAELASAATDGRSSVVLDVVRRTLLAPSGRVYFDELVRRFVVVEPKVNAGDVTRWASAD